MFVKVFSNSALYNTMNEIHIEKLIDLVKLNPELWQKCRMAPELNQKFWDDIGFELGTTGCDARQQWKILREQFRCENKRMKQNSHYKPRWMFYNKMLFTLQQRDPSSSPQTDEEEPYNFEFEQQNIHPFCNPNKEDAHVIINIRKSLLCQGDNDYALPSINEGARESVELNEDSPSTSAGDPSSTQTKEDVDINAKRYCTQTKEDVDINAKRYSTQTKEDVDINEISGTNAKRFFGFPDDGDDDYYFVMSLVPSMRFIPRSKKLIVRSKIMNVIQSVLEGGL